MPRKPIAPVFATGDTRASLEALRDYLADALDHTDSPRDQAPLASRLQAVTEALRDMTRGGASDDDNLFGAAPTVEPAPPGADS